MVNRLYQRLVWRHPEIRKLEAYYEGKQPLKFASAEWAKAHGDRYGDFSDNWCAVVADAPADRTAVVGFELPDTDGVFSAQEQQLWTDWQMNDMDAQQSQGFLMTRIARRSFITTWGDSDGNPVHTWDHPMFCEIEYDNENPRLRVAALRTWRDDSLEFATLYQANLVWKFQRKVFRDELTGRPTSITDKLNQIGSGGWAPRIVSGETWPARNPIGEVPMVEVKNRPMLRGEPLTDIGGVAPMQDAINLLWAYLFAAADYASMPARVVLGLEPPKIPILDKTTGEVIGEEPVRMQDLAASRLLYLTGQGGSIAQWDAAKLDVFTNTMGVAISHIASQTRTPSHYLATGAPLANADAARMDEVGLSQKVRETHLYCQAPVRETFRLSALVRGNDAVALAARAGAVAWRDPEIRSDAQLADAFQKDIASGWPFEWTAQHRRGLSPTEIADVMAMKRREAAEGLAAIRDAAADFTTSSFAMPGLPDSVLQDGVELPAPSVAPSLAVLPNGGQ